MSRTVDIRGNDLGATMFLLDIDAPGMEMVRVLDTIDSNSPGGHAVIDFKDVRARRDQKTRTGRRSSCSTGRSKPFSHRQW